MEVHLNREYIANLGRNSDVGNAVIECANDIHDVFKDIAPRDTGTMVRTSYVTLDMERGQWMALLTVPAENERGTKYGKFVEFGTRHMRAQHNLRHSIEIVERNNR